MYSTAQKKKFETHVIRKFLSHESHGLRIKNIIPSETPDFIIEELSKNISIELTQLIHPKLKQVESFQNKLVDIAWKQFKEKYRANLEVYVNFSNTIINCSYAELPNYATELSKIVEKALIDNKDYTFRLTSFSRCRPINEFIDSITIASNDNFDNWQPFGAFRVSRMDHLRLQRIVAKKEEMLQKYPAYAGEKWLVIAANFGYESSTNDFENSTDSIKFSKFDRVYLYKYMDDEYERLY